jgi:predicted DCC family thiol-disulfide oxidoreductase YuxK
VTAGALGRRLAVSLVLLAAWLAFATLAVPPLIMRAYHGESLPLFNALIISRESHALGEYLAYWRNVTWLGAAWSVAVWFIAPVRRLMSSPSFFERAVGAATPATLGAIRSWTCGVLLVMTLWEDLASTTLLPRELVRPKGVLHLLHALPIGFERFLASATALWTFEHLTALLLLLGVFGLGTRIVVPAAAACYLVLAGILREYSWFYHTGLIPLYVLIALSFTPCGDGWSLDRLIKVARGRPVPPAEPGPVYGWARYLVWTVIGVPYVAAALSKLYYGGILWFHPDNMLATLLRTTLAPMEFEFRLAVHLVNGPAAVLVFLAIVGLFSELLFAFVLVSPLARRVVPMGVLATHVGILFLQNILFIDLILLQAVFYDFGVLRRAVARRFAGAWARTEVLYDGRCGLCGRAVRIAASLDLFDHLDLRDFRTMDLSTYAGRTQPPLEPSWLEHSMAAVVHGRVYTGFAAWRAVAWSLPAGWIMLPVLYLPGVRAVGDVVYGHVAKRRHAVCTLDRTVHAPVRPDREAHARGSLASLALTAFLLSWWTTHIEFFPFTTMKMFSALNLPFGQMSYVKPMAVHEDGRRTLARFERWIGAMADSRYRQIIMVPFEPAPSLGPTNAFLDAAMRAANRTARAGDRVVGFEIEFWRWRFRADPDSPTQGTLVQTYVFPPGTDAHRH